MALEDQFGWPIEHDTSCKEESQSAHDIGCSMVEPTACFEIKFYENNVITNLTTEGVTNFIDTYRYPENLKIKIAAGGEANAFYD